MSITELGLIIIVAVLVLKPNDVAGILRYFRQLSNYLASFKKEIYATLDEAPKSAADQETINRYLAKIIQLEGKYEGEYNLASVKAYYHKLLIKNKASEEL